MWSSVENALTGQLTLPWLLRSRPAGTTLGRGCSFLESKGQALLEKAAVTRWVQELWQSLHHESKLGCRCKKQEACLWWGPDSQPSLRGDRKIGNQKGLVRPIEQAIEPSWVARDPLSSLRGQFGFSVVSRSSSENSCFHSTFPCSKKTSVWKSGISWCPCHNKVLANSGWMRAASRLALSTPVLSEMGALVCYRVIYCRKGNNAVLPMNSWGLSLLCDTPRTWAYGALTSE